MSFKKVQKSKEELMKLQFTKEILLRIMNLNSDVTLNLQKVKPTNVCTKEKKALKGASKHKLILETKCSIKCLNKRYNPCS